MIWDGAEISVDGSFRGELWRSLHVCFKCVRICAGALDSQNEPTLNLEFDRRTDAGLGKLMSTTEKLKRHSSDRMERKKKKKVWHHYMNSCCQTRTMERKSQLKTIKVSLFSVREISFSCSCFCIGDGSDDGELVNHAQQWEDVGVASATPMRPCRGQSDSVLHPATCYLLRLSATSDAAGGIQRIRRMESLKLNLERTILAWYDRMIFVTTEGYNGLWSPAL